MNENKLEISICHLYPDLLNLYGDRGNIITLQKRCEWRGIKATIDLVEIGENFESDKYDIVFLGGGQDFEQSLILEDLVKIKGDAIRKAVEDNMVFLCICGGFQMMGEYYIDSAGKRLDCLNAIPIFTVAGKDRLIGNIICESTELAKNGKDPMLVGFENHSGRTILKPNTTPLALVKRGYGNNGEDKTEGARYKNVYCTYMHGSFLPRNPDMADELIIRALERKYNKTIQLEQINEKFEHNARKYAQTCKRHLTD